MTTANLSLHSQRALTYGVGETTSGNVYVGQIAGSRYDAALRFEPPADLVGATITSVMLTIYAKNQDLDGGVLIRFGLADNADNLSSQDLEGATSTSYDYLHSTTYGSFASPPASSELVGGTLGTYIIDLTDSATVSHLENDIIVLCQFSDYFDYTGQPADATILFDGLGDSNPPTLEIVYTPAATGQTIESDPAIETNTASASTIVNARTYSSELASESNTVLASTTKKTVTAGLAIETNTAPPSTIRRIVSSGIATETNTAPASTIKRNRTIVSGIAIETNTALASVVQKNQTIASGFATEINTAPASVATVPQTIASGVATETNTAPASSVTFGQVVSSGFATEINTVPSPTVQRNRTIVSGIAIERNTAPASTVIKSQGGLIRQFFQHLAG